MVIKNEINGHTKLILYPNRSASWMQVKSLLLAFGLFCLLIALIWTWMGAWLVLPFAGLEVGLLIFIMLRVVKQSHRKESITFFEHVILVQSGIAQPTLRWDIEREKAKLLLMEVRHPEDPLCIHLTDPNNRVELGRYLNADDKKQLLSELKSQGLTPKKVPFPVQIEI